ncbi:MAG TPA: PEP-CTERM sorting domain-containing protein [Myxococcota bacterium]|nr:PEP-CTERM sorting domain-containing protein [Myxococcota bacterium]
MGAAGADGAAGAPGDPGQSIAATLGDPDPLNSLTLVGGAGGGGGDAATGSPDAGGSGGAGGSATGTVTNDSTSGAESDAFITGGAGGAGGVPGGVGGVGGAASAAAQAISDGPVQVTSQAIGGAGGAGAVGGDGGAASASAVGRSYLGEASLSVVQVGGEGGNGSVQAGAGHDSRLANAAVGAAPGVLSLSQQALGGDAGVGPGARGGQASSVLARSADTGDVVLVSVARGGDARSPDGSAAGHAIGGDAHVTAVELLASSGSVDITANARGGSAWGPNAEGGHAFLDQVYGTSSGGGAVTVRGFATEGSGVRGGSLFLNDTVQGDTTGALSLIQGATGGSGTESAGAAESDLSREGSYSSLHVETIAAGGNVRGNVPMGADPTAGATGTAHASAFNLGGGSEAVASAIGGGNAFTDFGHGATTAAAGMAQADASAVNGPASATASSQGGSAGDSKAGSVELGSGGAADSVAGAVTYGTGDATASSTAQGGLSVGPPGPLDLQVGVATAEANATAQGTGAAVASAVATGGNFIDPAPMTAPRFGSAHALARASGFGPITATATSSGGTVTDSTSLATALGGGALPSAYLSLGGANSQPVGQTLTSIVEYGAALSHQESLDLTRNRSDTIGLVNALPGASDAATWLAGNPHVLGRMSPDSHALAVGFVYEHADQQTWNGSYALALDRGSLPANQTWAVAFLGASFPASSLDSLVLELSIDGHTILDEHFADAAEAQAALSDRLVVIDPGVLGPGPISNFSLQYFVDGGTLSDQVRSEFALVTVHVPEPALLGLMVFGVGLLAGLRQRHR